jgi:hypothetical protein
MPYKRVITLPPISRNISAVVSLIAANVLMGRGMGLTGMPITIALLSSGGLKSTLAKPFLPSQRLCPGYRAKREKGRETEQAITGSKWYYHRQDYSTLLGSPPL